jgi:hypothetical protein
MLGKIRYENSEKNEAISLSVLAVAGLSADLHGQCKVEVARCLKRFATAGSQIVRQSVENIHLD